MVRAGSFILGLKCHFEPRQATPTGDGRTEGERLCYPSARQGPRLRWQFPPVYPGGQMQRYPPSPVSMQVALLAQGLDEHWRASERQGGKLKQREKKRKEKLFLDLVCPPSSVLSLARSLPPPSSSASVFVSALSRLVFTPQASCHRRTKLRTRRRAGRAAHMLLRRTRDALSALA